MSENVLITPGTGDTVAADDIGGVKFQRVKLIHGADGVNAGDVATGNPLPVVQTGTPALPTGASSAANQTTANGSLASIDGKLPAALGTGGGVKVDIVSGASGGGLTDTQLRATAVPVSAASLPLPAGASTSAKQPALGTAGAASADVITVQGVASMTALKVDGSAVTQPVSGTVTSNAGTGTHVVAGDLAHDAADSGNPVKIGGKARTALPAVVAAGDRADVATDTYGRLMVCHIDPSVQMTKAMNYTTTQTGGAVWSATSGKKVCITSVVLAAYGTTAARVILWFAASGTTVYVAGTHMPLVIASFAPSATAKPGLVYCPAVPIYCPTVDFDVKITTDAGISIDVTISGFEYN